MLIVSIVLLILGFSLLLAKVSRMAGGGSPKLPLGLDQWIFGLPFALAGAILNPYLTALTYLSAVLGKRLGHGQYFDLATTIKKITAEKLDVIVKLFFGSDHALDGKTAGNFWRDFFGLSLVGSIVHLGAVIALMVTGHFAFALAVFVLSFHKGLSYFVSRRFTKANQSLWMSLGVVFDDLSSKTESAEYNSGFLDGLIIFTTIAILLL